MWSQYGKPLPASQLQCFSQHDWQGRRWQWVDPYKDLSAAEKAVTLCVKSRRQIADEMGVDFDDVLAQLLQEQQQLQQQALSPLSTPESQPNEDDT